MNTEIEYTPTPNDKLESDVILWGYQRLIPQNSTSLAQASKAAEELNGELIPNAAKLDILREIQATYDMDSPVYSYLDEVIWETKEKLKDDIGDVLVCLIMIAEIEETTIFECLATAYEDIKDRKGYIGEDGKFHKEV